MRSRATSNTSQKFSVVNNASRAPRRWITVLTPTVVPCTKAVMFDGSMPCAACSVANPSMISAPGRDGVVRTLSVVISPLSSSKTQKSMNVPPMSMPTR